MCFPLSPSSLSFGELSHVTSLCRSAWSAATAPFTSFHHDQKHFHIFSHPFRRSLVFRCFEPATPFALRAEQGCPTEFLVYLLDTQHPFDRASVSIMRSSACLSELSQSEPCLAKDSCLRYLLWHKCLRPRLLQNRSRTAPEPVRLLLGSKWLPDHACHISCSCKQ